jgi:hypothetical protein
VETAIAVLVGRATAAAAPTVRTFPHPQEDLGGDPGDLAGVQEDALLPSDIRRLPLISLGSQAPDPVFPSNQIPPSRAFLLDLPLDMTALAVLAGATSTIVTWPQVPLGMMGVVRKIGWATSQPATTRFTTLVNGAPVQPYQGRIGPVGSLELPQDTQILLQSGDIFSVVALNGAGVVAGIQVRTYGWFWLTRAEA